MTEKSSKEIMAIRRQKRRSLALVPVPNKAVNSDENLPLQAVCGLFKVETTTTKPLQEIFAEIERVFTLENIQFKKSKKRAVYKCKSKTEKVQFELEICRIEKLESVKGLKFKRTSGDIWKYMQVYNSLSSQFKL